MPPSVPRVLFAVSSRRETSAAFSIIFLVHGLNRFDSVNDKFMLCIPPFYQSPIRSVFCSHGHMTTNRNIFSSLPKILKPKHRMVMSDTNSSAQKKMKIENPHFDLYTPRHFILYVSISQLSVKVKLSRGCRIHKERKFFKYKTTQAKTAQFSDDVDIYYGD